MAEAGVIGVDVIVEIGTGATAAILGQRNASLTYGAEMIDMTVKADWPYKSSIPGWEGPWTISCDGLLMAGGANGIAGLINLIKGRTLVNIQVTVGDSGEEFTGTAWMTNVQMNSPQDGEGTMSCELTGEGELTATEGS